MSCTVSSGGTLDNIMVTFCDSMLKYGSDTSSLANKIFMTLFALEFLWQLTVKKVFTGDVEKLWVFFFTRSAMGLFFANYLVNIDVYRGIIMFIARLGAKLGGFTIDFKGSVSNVFAGITPSSMVSYFYCATDVIHKGVDNTGTLQFITVKIMLGISLVLFFVVIMIISFLLMEVFIKTYFLLYVGFILTGFAGSSWTMNYWQRYLQQISAMALEFLTQCILLGVLKNQCDSWVNLLTNANGDIVQMMGVFINMLGVAIIFVLLMYSMPRWAGKTLAGEIRLNLSDKFSGISSYLGGR